MRTSTTAATLLLTGALALGLPSTASATSAAPSVPSAGTSAPVIDDWSGDDLTVAADRRPHYKWVKRCWIQKSHYPRKPKRVCKWVKIPVYPKGHGHGHGYGYGYGYGHGKGPRDIGSAFSPQPLG